MKRLMFQKELYNKTNKTSSLKKCMLCIIGILVAGFKFEPHICNKCHDVLMPAYELKNIAILTVTGVDYRCILWGISKNDAANILNNSVLEDKGFLYMDFRANKTPIEVIKEGAFGGTYFRDIYSGVNEKWYRKLWKNHDLLKDIDQKYYRSRCYDVSVNEYGVKCGTLVRFWENNG